MMVLMMLKMLKWIEMIWNDFDPNDHNVNDNVNVMAL